MVSLFAGLCDPCLELFYCFGEFRNTHIVFDKSLEFEDVIYDFGKQLIWPFDQPVDLRRKIL